jgi:hypothetical protein
MHRWFRDLLTRAVLPCQRQRVMVCWEKGHARSLGLPQPRVQPLRRSVLALGCLLTPLW